LHFLEHLPQAILNPAAKGNLPLANEQISVEGTGALRVHIFGSRLLGFISDSKNHFRRANSLGTLRVWSSWLVNQKLALQWLQRFILRSSVWSGCTTTQAEQDGHR
jgi:hypothetical protein